MKSIALLSTALFLSSVMTATTSYAANISQQTKGYKCLLIPGTLKFSGGPNSEAVRSFTDFSSVSLYLASRLMSGDLTQIAPESLEFKPIDTMVTVAKLPRADDISGDTAYPTVQTTELFDAAGKQLKNEADLPEKDSFFNVYTHTFENLNGGAFTKFVVVVTEEQTTDHASTKSATMSFKYVAPSMIPKPMLDSLSGEASAELLCEDQR